MESFEEENMLNFLEEETTGQNKFEYRMPDDDGTIHAAKNQPLRNFYADLSGNIKEIQKYMEINGTQEKILAMQKYAAKTKSLDSALKFLEKKI